MKGIIGQLFSVRRLKANCQNYKETGSIYTLEKVYTCIVQSTLSQEKEQNKQTDKCTLGNFFEPKEQTKKKTEKCTLGSFFASYQSPTDHCRGRTLNN